MSDSKTVSGKVISVQAAGKFTGRTGKDTGKLKYKFDIALESGAHGQLAVLESELNGMDCPIAVGETHEFNVYTSTNPEYPDNWYLRKAKAEGGWKGGGRAWTPDPERESRKERWAKQILIGRQACLNTAASLIASGCGPSTVENLTGLAEAMEEWVKRGLNLKAIAAGPVQNGGPPQANATLDPQAAYRKQDAVAAVPDPF